MVLVAAACSSSPSAEEPAPSTTLAPTTLSAPSTTSVAATTTVPPTITTPPVTAPGGKVVAIIAAVDGTDTTTMPIPANVGRPAIIHAKYDGAASFVVRALDAGGRRIATLARSLGPYDGTFPVGFVNQSGNPVASLQVDTTGPWHLDITKPVLAPELSGRGVSGHGDAVLAYKGPAVSARITFAAPSAFAVNVFGNGAVTMLVSTVGPYNGTVAIPAGPALISVTATGDWSMVLR